MDRLVFKFGEYFELNSPFMGLDDATEAIVSRLKGTPANLGKQIAKQQLADPPIALWTIQTSWNFE